MSNDTRQTALEWWGSLDLEIRLYLSSKYDMTLETGLQIEKIYNSEHTDVSAIFGNICRYCEDKEIYDKLSSYGDFYYKAKNYAFTTAKIKE